MNAKNTSDLYCIWVDNLSVHAFPVTQIHELGIASPLIMLFSDRVENHYSKNSQNTVTKAI